MSRHILAGTLPIDSPFYVVREADESLYHELKKGEFCYILNSRQTGKSSLKVRTMQRLREDGFICIDIDLTQIGTGDDISIEQWYTGVIYFLAKGIKLDESSLNTWSNLHSELSPVMRLRNFIEEKLVSHPKEIVIFIDEIDSVLSHKLKGKLDDFFALIRSCYNQRADKPEFNSITFMLLGVATTSDLICDQNRTPFNIGTAIELNGFRLNQAQPLLQTLEGRVSNPQAVLQAILAWTGGQPFLTQKLCALVTNGMEASGVEQLVKQQIIENWESQDNAQHLKTIRDRIVPNLIDLNLSSLQSVERLLMLYEQILYNQQITADNSREQQQLLLLGLVVKQETNLTAYNDIYPRIFDYRWVRHQLLSVRSQIKIRENEELTNRRDQMLNQRPYSQEITEWIASNRHNSKLLRGKKLNKAIEWRKVQTLPLPSEDQDFISQSQSLKERKNQKLTILIITVPFLVVGLGVAGSFWHIDQVNQKSFSEGNRTLFKEIENANRDEGIEAFKKKDYSTASEYFKKAIKADSQDPEVQIYANNAAVLNQEKLGGKDKPSVTLAVVVPLDIKNEVAAEMLRGVAQAQTNFNETSKSRFLKIVIAKDDNDPKKAKQVAQKLIKKLAIIGVIGHNTSKVTEAALPEYEKGSIAIISPTSTSTSLENNVFFRTVPNNDEIAKTLATYAIKNNYKQVGICNNPNNTYSADITDAFEKHFELQGGSIVGEQIDLTYPGLDASGVVAKMLDNQANASILFPNTESISVVVEIASAQNKLSQQGTKKLPLLGGDSLYNSNIFNSGGEPVEGLVLAVPWFPDETNSKAFAKKAEERWKGKVSWRTAASYDATQAFIQAMPLSGKPTRENILKNLKSIKLEPDETSGKPLKFDNQGERKGQQPVLVKVVGGNFKPVE
ncbi:AAA-like domain-containing protein [Limnofasciculus baicalensis]|uniref:ABC transporter substrate-binding protein n=1 Tax=Limnofasciculus baicalensis BBK-W-15 TaxID=2699891 RepID=A0AAE3GSU0_9CYAN|nr:AAA-like domain-containing protein [Limnofasciculus baicalensis]MCP2730090.1 ABC transporter substrate-binding protein [Limnofasciculus baicalensis BBK-W-15]